MKKQFVALVLTLLCGVVLFTGCALRVQYKRIELDGDNSGLKEHVNFMTRVEMTATETFSETMPVYEIKPREITEEEFRQMADYFEIEEEIVVDADVMYIRGATDKHLRLECPNKLSFWYTGNRGTDDKITQSDEELIEEAKRIMSELPIIEGDYECLGVASLWTAHTAEGDYPVKKRVAFRKIIDGTRVIGDERCDLYFDADGLDDIEMELYDYEKTGEIEMLSLDDALDKVKKPDAFSIESENSAELNGKADTLCVERVKLLFVNQYSDGCTILQPVFNMIGTATNESGSVEFSSKIIAIPDKYTYEE